jgi:hypothetical protein
MDFRVKITAAANETFAAREGAHDDLVLATALPIWLGSQRFYQMSTRTPIGNAVQSLRPREVDAFDREQAALERAELHPLEMERQGRNRKTDRDLDRRKRRDREIEANILSDALWNGAPAPSGPKFFIIKADDPELLDRNLRGDELSLGNANDDVLPFRNLPTCVTDQSIAG